MRLRSCTTWACKFCGKVQTFGYFCSQCGLERGRSPGKPEARIAKDFAPDGSEVRLRVRRRGNRTRQTHARRKGSSRSRATVRSAALPKAPKSRRRKAANNSRAEQPKRRRSLRLTQAATAAHMSAAQSSRQNHENQTHNQNRNTSGEESVVGQTKGSGDMFKDEHLCRICHRPDDSGNNRFVFCDRCFSGYHQNCHPKLEKVPSGIWRCALCDPDEYKTEIEMLRAQQNQGASEKSNGSRPRRSPRKPLAARKWNWNEPTLEPLKPWSRDAVTRSNVDELYKVIQKNTGRLGGNATGGAIYGEMTKMSFQRVVDAMVDKCGLDGTSIFLDIGAGLGKPNMHVAIEPGVQFSVGVEIMPVRWQLSLLNLKASLSGCAALKEMRKPNVAFALSDITEIEHFNPFTHIYMYDIAFTPPVMNAIAKAFNSSSSAQYLVSYHKPRKIIYMHGFLVNLVTYVPGTSMHGSGQKRTAWVYKKTRMVEKNTEAKVKTSVLQRCIKTLKRTTSTVTYAKWLGRELDKTLYEKEGVNPREKRHRGIPFYRGCLVPY